MDPKLLPNQDVHGVTEGALFCCLINSYWFFFFFVVLGTGFRASGMLGAVLLG